MCGHRLRYAWNSPSSLNTATSKPVKPTILRPGSENSEAAPIFTSRIDAPLSLRAVEPHGQVPEIEADGADQRADGHHDVGRRDLFGRDHRGRFVGLGLR